MRRVTIVLVLVLAFVGACAKKKPAPVASTAPPPAATAPVTPSTPPPPPPAERVEESIPVPSISEDAISNRSLEDLNRDSPFKPAFFGLDSSDLDDAGRAVVAANADIMKKYPTWVVTVEGHCDERGTAEYNLALGERRAVVVKTYLVSLGVSPDRLRTVSYGKEFPFDAGHAETAWSKNRRAHFVITSK
ncbi:MAG TPA: peptidoglycan-associated lipoprotein Pal [Vicinamibacterales bacterium]|jgi:peptidoglycan-associated lipoprotein|nr:peptidoglycan-associated lipoprotein Pal [Vicinamibacterales bacterium]